MRRKDSSLAEARSEFIEQVRADPSSTPDIAALCRRYPEIEEEIRQLLADYESSKRLSSLLLSLPDGPAYDSPWFESQLHRPRREAALAMERFRFLGEIGRGGMGRVDEVWDGELDRIVARKVQLGRPDPDDPIAQLGFERRRARILTEARVMAHLEHPGVVPLHELGIDGSGRACFTMQRVVGRGFGAIIDAVHSGDARWSLRDALRCLLNVAETIGHAHARGLLHRDLKPDNIMVGEHGQTFVMDWGLAKLGGQTREDVSDPADLTRESLATESADLLATMDGEVVGTPAYMPPEQASGRGEQLGQAADIYGLGAILYHLLSGRAPYSDQLTGSPSPREIIEAVGQGPPTPLHDRDLGDRSLHAICELAMARNLQDRYDSAIDFGNDLRGYLGHHAVAAFRGDPMHRMGKWARRNASGIAAVGIPLLLVGAAVGGLLLDARSERDVARRMAETAQQERRIADQQTDEAQARLETLKDLDLANQIPELVSEADRFWPAYGEKVPLMNAWLERVEVFAQRLPVIDRILESNDGSLSVLESRALSLVADQLRPLVHPEPVASPGLGVIGSSLPAVRSRIALAEKTVGATGSPSEIDARWKDVIEDVAREDGAYPGLTIAPRPGLVPLEVDPSTGLWEFWHIQSGERPERTNGFVPGWRMDVAAGLVFVLVPGGASTIGTDSDPRAEAQEGPQRELELEAFYVSKYEMTQAQWNRLADVNPSEHVGNDVNLPDPTRPVESVTWSEARRILGWFDLHLPSEAQWEYAARGGAPPGWELDQPDEALAEVANLADESRRDVQRGNKRLVPWDDGYPKTAPVGEFYPNGFGLHDVHGNVREWCGDGFKQYADGGFAEGTGLRDVKDVNGRMARGSSYLDDPSAARITRRTVWKEDHWSPQLGLRPCMSIERPSQ